MTKNQKLAVKYLAKWLPLFGFSNYEVLHDTKPDDDKFAHVRYSVEEEWMCVTFCPAMDALTPEQVEHVVCHELTHVLMALALSSEVGEEIACNRVAGLLVGSEHGVRSLVLMLLNDATIKGARVFDDDEREVILDALPGLIARLPEKHRTVLFAIHYDGKSQSQLARELGVNRSTMMRRENAATEALRKLIVGEL